MKLITAVVTPSEFEAVKKALDIFGITGLTITEVFQRDLASGRDQIYRGQRFHVDLVPHVPHRTHHHRSIHS
jgi:nitrogen regulatory protein P-II 1